MSHHHHPDEFLNDPAADESQARRVARATARTVPWAMGTLAAGLRERGGVHASQFKALMSLHHGGVTPSELAERMRVSLPTVSKTVSVLERNGWVMRSADDKDRRRTLLALTDEGRSAVRGFMECGVEQLADAFASADASELDRIERGMEALRDVLARAHEGRRCRHGEPGGGV